MKNFALFLIVMLCGLIIYNLIHIDFSNPSWENNSTTYFNLIWSFFIITSLIISYRILKIKAK